MHGDTRSTRRSILGAAGVAGVGMALSGHPVDNASAAEPGRERAEVVAEPAGGGSKVESGKVIGFPLYQGATLLDFAGATQIFKFASMTPIWLAPQIGPIATTEGVSVLPTHTFGDHPPIDLLFVPGGAADGVIAAMFDPVTQRFLRAVSVTASWSGSVCTGAFVIAAAGLLDGCKATTYWSQIPNLKLLGAKRKIEVPDGYPRFLIDPTRKRFSGGGISSSIDLALELVATLNGKEAAQTAQLSVQYAPHPPVCAGDPSQAPADLTRRLRELQEKDFIAPVRQAVERILAVG
jgi:cyclohexyl-isocyanide hydratase